MKISDIKTVSFENSNLNNIEKKESKEWFGSGPKHWEIQTINDCFVERKTKVSDKDFSPLSVTKNGIVPQLGHVSKSSDNDNRKLVKTNDFVINSRSDRRGSSGLSVYDGSVSLINIVITPNKKLLPEYVHFLFRSKDFQEEFYRNGRGIVDDLWTTDYNEMRKIKIPVPPIEEQEVIIQKLKNVEKFINLKGKLQDLYKEYESSLSSELIKGL